MITDLRVKGFKRFTDQHLGLAPLTILAGLNGSGKSSIIQSLLLLRQASQAPGEALLLNGPFDLKLGSAEEVLNWSSSFPLEFGIASGAGDSAVWRFDNPDAVGAMYLEAVEWPEKATARAFASRGRVFAYLSAERRGPQALTMATGKPQDSVEVGCAGEHVAELLALVGNDILEEQHLAHPAYGGTTPRLLKYEVESWLSEIARPIEIDALSLGEGFAYELRFRVPGDDWVRATNMGFGLSYSLPIVLAGLTLSFGGLLIVENPEAHLHPAGQSRVGAFLAWLAGRGIQVVCETHSDHVINGIRRAIADFKFLKAEDAIIHYIPESYSESAGAIDHITFRESGSLSKWPPGFLDQYTMDVAALGSIRRRV